MTIRLNNEVYDASNFHYNLLDPIYLDIYNNIPINGTEYYPGLFEKKMFGFAVDGADVLLGGSTVIGLDLLVGGNVIVSDTLNVHGNICVSGTIIGGGIPSGAALLNSANTWTADNSFNAHVYTVTPASNSNSNEVATTKWVTDKGFSTGGGLAVLSSANTWTADNSFNAHVYTVTPASNSNSNEVATTKWVTDKGFSTGGGLAVLSSANTWTADNSFNAHVYTVTPASNSNSNEVATTKWVTDKGFSTGGGLAALSSANTWTADNSFNAHVYTVTPASNSNTNEVATTKWVMNQGYGTGPNLVNCSNIWALDNSFNGNVYATTPATSTNTNQVATTKWVNSNYAPIESPGFGGEPTAPSVFNLADYSDRIATTLYTTDMCNSVKNTLHNYANTWYGQNDFKSNVTLTSNVVTFTCVVRSHQNYIWNISPTPTITGSFFYTCNYGYGVPSSGTISLVAGSSSVSGTFWYNPYNNERYIDIVVTFSAGGLDCSVPAMFYGSVGMNNNVTSSGITVFTGTSNVTFSGATAGTTPDTSDNSTKLATTAFVKNQNYISTNAEVVGIGTTTPDSRFLLHIQNAGKSKILLDNANSLEPIEIFFQKNSENNCNIGYYYLSADGLYRLALGSGHGIIMRDYVGFGNNWQPNYPIDVTGDINYSGDLCKNGTRILNNAKQSSVSLPNGNYQRFVYDGYSAGMYILTATPTATYSNAGVALILVNDAGGVALCNMILSNGGISLTMDTGGVRLTNNTGSTYSFTMSTMQLNF